MPQGLSAPRHYTSISFSVFWQEQKRNSWKVTYVTTLSVSEWMLAIAHSTVLPEDFTVKSPRENLMKSVNLISSILTLHVSVLLYISIRFKISLTPLMGYN